MPSSGLAAERAETFTLFRPSPPGAAPQLEDADPADDKQWPATFIFMGLSEPCTATAVGPNVVVTAAHCVEDGAIGRISSLGLRVACRRHPRWGGAGAPFDIALCFSKSAMSGMIFEKISLSAADPATQTKVHLLGFGCTAQNGPKGVLYEGKSIVSQAPTLQIQAFVTQYGATLCAGDSGGAAYAVDAVGRRAVLGLASRRVDASSSAFASIPALAVQSWIKKWAAADGDKDGQTQMKVEICGLDQNLQNCRS